MLCDMFEVASGSVTGRNHITSGKNNQDAFHVYMGRDYFCAIVCDGCSEGAHSEVGAQIGARIVARALEGYVVPVNGDPDNPSWEMARQEILDSIQRVVHGMGMRTSEIVKEYFLFTVIGVVATWTQAAIFSIGDGVFSVNGEITHIGPFPDNAPPYLGYGLVRTSLDPALMRFRIHRVMPTSEITSLLIGSDGVLDFIAAAERRLPGKKDLLGSIENFWAEDRYFTNPDNIRRRLALANYSSVKISESGDLVREVGLLPDDTTMVVIRSKVRSAGGE